MSIAFNKYVDIISGVGGGNTVRQRDLIGRFFTQNVLVSPGVILEFRSAADTGTFFGTNSEEFRRAVDYFAYISPSIARAKRISFGRWAEAGTNPQVIGNNDGKVLASIQAITAGGIAVTFNGTTYPVNGVTFAAAATMADVAAALQVAIRAANAALAAATVTYGVTGPSRFTVALPGGFGDVSIASVTTGAQDIGVKLGLSAAANALNIKGVGPQTAVEALDASINITNNFGSFLFLDDLDLAETEAVAAFNATFNVMYMFAQRVTLANYATWYTELQSYAGLALTLMDKVAYPNEYPDQIPMIIEAATDYNKRNGVQNYMFRQFQNNTPLVKDTPLSDLLDNNRTNYYGQTQTAGQLLAFYQRGVLMGLATAPVDMNVFANEAWLKDYAGSQIMGLQLSVSRIPANTSGEGMILNILQPVIDAGLSNGVISVGKELTPLQKVFIEEQTGDVNAWHAVQDVGYHLSIVIEPYTTPDGRTEYKAVYTLIYSKDDVIRLVQGTHQLI